MSSSITWISWPKRFPFWTPNADCSCRQRRLGQSPKTQFVQPILTDAAEVWYFAAQFCLTKGQGGTMETSTQERRTRFDASQGPRLVGPERRQGSRPAAPSGSASWPGRRRRAAGSRWSSIRSRRRPWSRRVHLPRARGRVQLRHRGSDGRNAGRRRRLRRGRRLRVQAAQPVAHVLEPGRHPLPDPRDHLPGRLRALLRRARDAA